MQSAKLQRKRNYRLGNELEAAPNYIKVAVDLIMLLEQNEVPAEDVLAALEIVKSDYEKKRVKPAE